MARIIPGPNISDIRGRQGSTVYSVWKAGCHYTRSLPVYYQDPETDIQIVMRDCKACALAAWTLLLLGYKALWEEYAKKCVHRNQDLDQGGGTTNLIPHHRPPYSGQNAFVQAYLRLCRLRTKTHNVPATIGQPCCLEDLAVALPDPYDTIEVTWTKPTTCGYNLTEYLNQNFEGEIVGSTPDLWTPAFTYSTTGTAAIICDNTRAHGGTKSCKCGPGTGVALAKYAVPGMVGQNHVVLDYWFNVDDATPFTYLPSIRSVDDLNVCVFVAVFQEFLRYYDGLVQMQGPTVLDDTWYHVRYIIHPETRTYDLYFDDMCNPYVTDVDYYANVDAGYIGLQGRATALWVDDIHLYYCNQWVKAWLLSYAAHAHKQIVCQQPANLGAMSISKARYAGGVLSLLSNNPGLYYLQFDVLGIDEIQNGLLSVPSEIFRVVIP